MNQVFKTFAITGITVGTLLGITIVLSKRYKKQEK